MWQENDFGKNLPVDFADTLRVKNFVKIALACFISEINVFLHFTQKFKMAGLCFSNKLWVFFAFYAEIQDGRQKWRENHFCENLSVDSGDTHRFKNFAEIALALTISKIKVFLCFQN